MSEKDFMVGVTGIPSVGHITKKPCYLLSLDNKEAPTKRSKNNVVYFIAIDKPDLLDNFVHVKGIYSSCDEDEIVKKFSEIVAGTPKENIMDMMFPAYRIISIRSLVFNANKPATLIR